MNLLKSIAAGIASGGLIFATILPASAGQHYSRDHNRGYVSQNHHGYSGHRGYQTRHNNYGQNRYHYNHRGYNNQYRGHSGYRAGHNAYNHNQYNHNQYGTHHYRPRPGEYGIQPRNAYKPRYHWNPNRRVIWNPHFQQRHRHYHPRFRVGGRIALNRHARIHNYAHYGLHHPPRGHYWVRSDNDAYLAAAGTGLIAGIIIGAIASN